MHTTSTFEIPCLNEFSRIGAENNPDRVAFGQGSDGPEVTWGDFDRRSRRVANALRETVAQGDRVAYLCDCSVEHVTLWNGALKAGCTVSNLHTRTSAETLRYCIDSLRPRVLVVDEEFSDTIAEQVRGRITTDVDLILTTGTPNREYEVPIDAFVADASDDEPDIRTREDDVAAVLWTSGTTGRPKGWCHTHRGLFHKAMKLEKMLAIGRTSSVPHVFTPSFAAWYSLLLPGLYSNASTYFLRDWDPEEFLAMVDERAATSAVLIPTMWKEVLRRDDLPEYDLDSLERIVTSGERLDRATLSDLREHVCDNVHNNYAATEVLGTSITDEELEGDRVESVGKPISGTEIRVIEPDGSPDAVKDPGEVGEIVIKGPDCAVWAWGDTAKTEAVFEDGWWYSGDLGYTDEEGYLFLEGRKDFMITSKGLKVFPDPVEGRLEEHPGVKQAAVVGVPDDEYGEMVVAVVRRSDADVTGADLDEWCIEGEDVARFERPREYVFTDDPLPRTSTGKLSRQSIRETYLDR